MEKIYVQRLERLHALALEIHADKQRRKRFNLSGWATEYHEDFGDHMDMPGWSDAVVSKDDGCVTIKEGACGTAACMIGWAGMDPEFNAQGFCLAIRGGYVNPLNHETGLDNWPAVTSFFGLSFDEAHDLFDGNAYASDTDPLAVACRIEGVLAEVRAGER
jgi:hypothetical protein